ncbi:hypothetical protein HK414_12035 [Ramlibacter terrae]|uniref:Tetratricopeptide repeat protein n=1 Tax=Ramlibacter terrae TaxID=2732511 RepID=A0ABX6P2J9_9BURK|nr:hypothetical protein HK414_12035 [Ramlibacter terrae]
MEDILRELLPFGIASFKFVVTVGESALKNKLNPRVSAKGYTLVALSPEDCERICIANGLPSGHGQQIFGITKGIPAKVVSAMRLLQAGKDIRALTGVELAEFFRHEWEMLPQPREEMGRALAYVAFAGRPLAVGEVCRYSGASEKHLLDVLTLGTFLRSRGQTGYLEVADDAHRRFLEQRLGTYKRDVLSHLTDELISNPKDEVALRFLPTYFEEQQRTQELISFLNSDTLERYVERGESVYELRRQALIGLGAARQLRQWQEGLRFALNVSFAQDADGSDIWESQLAALAALGRFEDALEVAQLPSTREDQLVLLARYAKARHARGLSHDALLESRLVELLAKVDVEAVGDKAMDIAGNLIGPFPDLALEIVDKAAGSSTAERDAAYVSFGLKLGATSRKKDSPSTEAGQFISRIADTSLQQFATAAEAIVVGRSPAYLQSALALQKGRARLYMIQRWLVVNAKHPEAVDLVKHTLNELIQDTSYLPSADDLRQLSAPCAFQKTERQSRISYP